MNQGFIKRPIAGFLLFALLLLPSSPAVAQKLYQPEPAMRLGVVDQLVNGVQNDRARNHETQRQQAEFARQAIYEKVSPDQQDWDSILNATRLTTDQTLAEKREPKSFIQRETQAAKKRESARDVVTRISINLAFVLAIAFGFILLVRQWQKSKLTEGVKPTGEVDTLKVRQVLPLAAGASLHVIDGFGSKCLVAIDASGIKSVNVLTPTFRETLEQTDDAIADDVASDAVAAQTIKIHTPEPIETDRSTSDIDENLIRLLLQSSKKAA